VLKIANGRVYDPANGLEGVLKDVFVERGRVVEPPPQSEECEVLDAAGLFVTPGAIDIHTHIAGPKVTSGRILRPEDHYGYPVPRTGFSRSGTGHTIPTISVTGNRYAAMGYTTVFEASIAPLKARHLHEEFHDLPLVDKGCYVLMGNNYFVMKGVAQDQKALLQDYTGWLLKAAGGYAIKVVNPGGVEGWKCNSAKVQLDTPVPPFNVTPRQILLALAEANEGLGLPHALHVHANDIGRAGNWTTLLETMKALEGRRAHFTHIQFHSYGITKKGGFRSGAEPIAGFLNEHPEFTVDVGQVMFGPATAMTADSPLQFRLRGLTGNKWSNADVEMESGSGVVPLVYRRNNLVNAVQWATGLELLLLIGDPWRVFITTDHPNGGPFTCYPRVIRLLMEPDFRREVLEGLSPRARRLTSLASLERAYTFQEIIIATRAGPARALGLATKGHLGVGADADVTIYRPQGDVEEMFKRPAYVLKGGQVVAREGEAVAGGEGRTLLAGVNGCERLPGSLRPEFEAYYSVRLDNYPVEPEYIPCGEVIACG
jgi:formylmethanofuran dehydrogenase subunit A